MEFTAWLAANAYDVNQLTEPQKVHLQAAWEKETKPPEKKPDPLASVDGYEAEMAATRRENDRVTQIRKITSDACKANVGNRDKLESFDKLCQLAIADGSTLEKFQLAMLREERSVGPMFHFPSKPQITNDVLEAAVCQAGGLDKIESHFNDQTLQSAHTKFRGGIGLHELIDLCATANGWHGRSVKSDLSGALRSAFRPAGEIMAEGPSTISIAGTLSNIANKFVREQFMFGEQTWRRITAIRAVSDFKQITTYSLTGDLTYEEIAPGGEIKNGTLGETSYTNQAKSYGKLLGIDRRDLINDDLNALSQVGRRLGRGAILKLNTIFWAAFLNNSTFFATGNLNYQAGATTTLMDLTGINNANTLFMNQIDPDGNPTGINPAIVLVPPQLWASAKTLLFSQNLNFATSTAASTGTASPWEGMFRLEVSRYLANSSFTGYSALAWYLLAEPNDTPVMETVFLNGAETPTIESADFEFDRLGISLRGYHDFGVSLQEFRGGVKMKGEA